MKKKKMAISVASMLYKLEPLELSIESTQHAAYAYVQDAAAMLLQQLMFLRDSLDENVRTSS